MLSQCDKKMCTQYHNEKINLLEKFFRWGYFSSSSGINNISQVHFIYHIRSITSSIKKIDSRIIGKLGYAVFVGSFGVAILMEKA